MTLDTIASITQIAGAVVVLPIAIWRGWRSMEKKISALDKCLAIMDQRTDRIEQQFGPNGGGLREAVNSQGKLLEKIDTRTIETVEDLATLKGRFDQMVANV